MFCIYATIEKGIFYLAYMEGFEYSYFAYVFCKSVSIKVGVSFFWGAVLFRTGPRNKMRLFQFYRMKLSMEKSLYWRKSILYISFKWKRVCPTEYVGLDEFVQKYGKTLKLSFTDNVLRSTKVDSLFIFANYIVRY